MADKIKTGGRIAGKPNRVTAGAKANIMEVFEMLGGARGFYEWAQENQTEFYRHYARLIPTEVHASIDGELSITTINRVIIDPAHDTDATSL